MCVIVLSTFFSQFALKLGKKKHKLQQNEKKIVLLYKEVIVRLYKTYWKPFFDEHELITAAHHR